MGNRATTKRVVNVDGLAQHGDMGQYVSSRRRGLKVGGARPHSNPKTPGGRGGVSR